ncbi:IclR family transcriptional regulator [Streptomyces sp. NPDC048002]|uniref:IclR family transcriptional regulator n=1 Tax=Streptomyces sp. NPDC048002 TaxID=3154344 RepID=UPI0033F85FDE
MAMSSTLTALAVLERLAQLQPVGLSELTRSMGLPKSTVQRCVETLHTAGWIEQESADTKRWVIGIRPFSVAVTAIQRGGLRDRAIPVMNRLSAETEETIHLAVQDGREIVLVERVDSPHAIRAVSPVGARGPLHASSNGKAILSALPDSEITAYVAGGLESPTDATIVDADALADEIADVRAAGFAVCRGELQDGVFSVASVIPDRSGHPAAALSVSGPRDRMNADRVKVLGPLVRAAAREIAGPLGLGS